MLYRCVTFIMIAISIHDVCTVCTGRAVRYVNGKNDHGRLFLF
jgi:hypothetical protein